MSKLISIQVGLPKTMGTAGAADPLDRPWTSAIGKEPIAGARLATAEGLIGDGVADRRFHGGFDKAMLAYCAEHYPKWRAELGRGEMGPGAFGENLTISGLDESSVCVGDFFQIGSVRVEVSQPRQPCVNLARRWKIKELPALVRENGRCGWYLRVTQEGELEAGMEVVLLERPYPEWTILRASTAMNNRAKDREAALELAACPALARDWVEELTA